MVLVVMLVSMVAGAVCMNKVSPVLTYIVNDLEISNSAAGLLISIFSISGIFLSIPMGMLITKYGSFRTGIVSLAAIIGGSALGAAAGNYSLLLVSRGVEGVGLMFLATIGPAAVASAFSDTKRGTAMGFLMCYMSFGQILALNIAPIIASSSSWRNFWWVSAAVGLIGLILWSLFARKLDSEESALDASENTSASATLKEVMNNKSVWLVCISFLAFMITHFGAFNYLPTYMSEVGGVSPTMAGSLTSIASLIGIPVGIIGGVVADRWGSRKKTLALNLLLLAVVVALIPAFSSSMYIVLVTLYGLASMAEAGLSFTAVTEVVRANQGATASAFLNTAQWIGAFLATTIFGALLDSLGWNMSFYIMAFIAVVGAITTFINRDLK